MLSPLLIVSSLTRSSLERAQWAAVRRLLAAIGVVAAGAAVLSASSYAQSFSPRVASGLSAARTPLAELRQMAERRSLGTTFVHVQQRLGGIPVLGSEATLSLGVEGEPLLVDHTWGPVARPAPARISKTAAIRRALSFAHVHALRAPARAGRVILPLLRLMAWRVVLPSARPLADFEVLVDARSGALVRLRNLVRDATTPALVFDPNPVVEQGSRTGPGGRRQL